MNMGRPQEHSVMPMFLQTHAAQHLKDAAEVDMYLRISALHCRGLVVVDSDLNNATLLHQAADYNPRGRPGGGHRHGGVFWTALRTGFIRRAARADRSGGPVSQIDVAEGLRRINPQRAARIPDDYLRIVNALCEATERESPPLVWTRADVDRYSLRRLHEAFLAAAKSGAVPGPHHIFDRVWEAIRAHQSDGEPFGAADIEAQFRPDHHGDSEEWKFIWALATTSQAGNIPFAFSGRLAITTTPDSPDKFLSAGPESAGVENEVEAALYFPQRPDGRLPRLSAHAERTGHRTDRFEFDKSRLAELRFEEIEEIREEALGAELFQMRFDAAASAADMDATATGLENALQEYQERLFRAGVLRTEQAERSAVEIAIREVVATADERDRAVRVIMKRSFAPPIGAHCIVLCDSQTIREQLGPDHAEQFLPADSALWTYRRPDYRVLKRRIDSES